VKPTFRRGEHAFIFPVLLAPWGSSDWRVVLAASALPPLAVLALKYGVVRPLRRGYKLRKARARAALLAALHAALGLWKLQP